MMGEVQMGRARDGGGRAGQEEEDVNVGKMGCGEIELSLVLSTRRKNAGLRPVAGDLCERGSYD